MENNKRDILIHLLEAYAKNDGDLFYRLCDLGEIEIFQEFKNWSKVPEWVREKEELVNLYIHTLGTIADYFAKKGKITLQQLLIGDASSNPLIQIENNLTVARNLFNNGEYEQSNKIILSLLQQLKKLSGTGVENMYPKVVGLLANNYLKLGDISNAKKFAEIAISKCMEIGDQEGETVYRKNFKLIVAYEAFKENNDHALIQTRSDIVTAQKLSDSCAYKKSNQLLDTLVDRIYNSSDVYIETYLTKVYGLLGMNFYYLKNKATAKEYTSLALEHARLNKDRPGIVIYSENLKVLERD